jgi:molecular chaperone GrpE
LDNLERALAIEVEDEAGKNLKKGIEMVVESLNQALKAEGIEIIDPLGEPFDPNMHEAYTQVPADNDQESGTVAQVFEKGYKLHERVLRAAKVAVVA